jgi:1-pyrroline-2-carboxylate reductase [NAD(P)H]
VRAAATAINQRAASRRLTRKGCIEMKIVEAHDVHRVLNFPDLVQALRTTFGQPAGTPRRTVYRLDESDPYHDAFAVLPAWSAEVIGVKAFTYLPSNAPKGRQILHSKILLFDRETGAPLALVDGTSVTYWRTAAVAALAADYLARRDVQRLLVCGTGNLAPYMILAHASVRNYTEIAVWGRDAQKAALTVQATAAKQSGLNLRVATDLEAEARNADVISCVTASREPLIRGEWVRPGTHTDFFGNHERKYRECDSNLVVKSRLYVDSRANTMNEAGEILLPIEEGRIQENHVLGELADLCAGRVKGRDNNSEVTMFKSVGTALSDLAAAAAVTQKI